MVGRQGSEYRKARFFADVQIPGSCTRELRVQARAHADRSDRCCWPRGLPAQSHIATSGERAITLGAHLTLLGLNVHVRNGAANLRRSAFMRVGSIAIDTAKPVAARPWYEVVQQTLKRNDVKLVTYVPDKVFTPLIRNLHADPDFLTFPTAREEEALGIVSGAWMGGRRGAVLMQTSGFGTIPNVLASLIVPYQVPAVMFVSERGTLGEFNLGQALVCRTMRPVLESLAVEFHTITRHDELEFIVDRSIKQAVATQAAVAFVLSPLLTGGKVFEA